MHAPAAVGPRPVCGEVVHSSRTMSSHETMMKIGRSMMPTPKANSGNLTMAESKRKAVRTRQMVMVAAMVMVVVVKMPEAHGRRSVAPGPAVVVTVVVAMMMMDSKSFTPRKHILRASLERLRHSPFGGYRQSGHHFAETLELCWHYNGENKVSIPLPKTLNIQDSSASMPVLKDVNDLQVRDVVWLRDSENPKQYPKLQNQ
ncbi:unnamed protein product [Calypogeia fissa]